MFIKFDENTLYDNRQDLLSRISGLRREYLGDFDKILKIVSDSNNLILDSYSIPSRDYRGLELNINTYSLTNCKNMKSNFMLIKR